MHLDSTACFSLFSAVFLESRFDLKGSNDVSLLDTGLGRDDGGVGPVVE